MSSPFQKAAALIERERQLLDRHYMSPASDSDTDIAVVPVAEAPNGPGPDLVTANTIWNPATSAPGVRFGGLKRLLLRLLASYTRGQVLFNGTIVRVVNDLDRRARALEGQARALEGQAEQHGELAARMALAEERRELWERRLAERVESLASRLSEVDVSSAEEANRRVYSDDKVAMLEEALTRVEAAVAGLRGFTQRLPDVPPSPDRLGLRAAFHVSSLAALDPSSALQQAAAIVRLFESAKDRLGSPALFVDLECGRGGLLEQARGAGLDAKGYDRNPIAVFHCRSLGIDARDGGPVDALSAAADSELAGVSALHVLETLTYPEAADLVRLVHRKLRPGGVFVLSSFNPGTLAGLLALHGSPIVGMPIPEPLAAYLLSDAGFSDVTVRPLEFDAAKDAGRPGAQGPALGWSEYYAAGTKS